MRLVCAVLPTKGRQRLAKLALESYLSQTYQNKRLFILDDASDPSFPDWKYIATVDYRMHSEQLNIPQKRNVLTGLAPKDSVIMNWDSDDWSAPDRMSSQMHLMEESRASMVGFYSMLFYEEQTQKAYKYEYMGGQATGFIIGTSMCFRRDWGLEHPFPNKQKRNGMTGVASDVDLWREAHDAKEHLITVDCGKLMVARVHSGNSSVKSTSYGEYKPIALDALPADFIP